VNWTSRGLEDYNIESGWKLERLQINIMPVKELERPSTIYGPVPSWRFGRSLGIDPIVQTSICSFNCIYCQLGQIQRITAERREYVPTEWVREDLQPVAWAGVDVVTISGSGEPTLATNLAEIIAAIKKATDKNVHILSNATLFGLPEVRQSVAAADVVACKLDAVDDEILQRMNRPAAGITLERIVDGIVALRGAYSGKLSLQIMLMPANLPRLGEWATFIKRIQPDEIQLNTPKRAYPLEWYRESRGDHDRQADARKNRVLKTISQAEAAEAERVLQAATGIKIISVYGES
jgi:wyosine [tRNA(Phe)-imidazoG37] synthetase (radical SAM superfamily)